MDISDYGVTELTFEDACAAVGGQPWCVWNPDEQKWSCPPLSSHEELL
ncbi:hypothetical protein GCM10007858_50640 [Bradyrhizobium liaoningense]|nr:hypothetical protein BEL01nite_84210 [Bradyrhizobium elkanii]GLR97423.1 hypothetical protein GCM10007858_50640 [Bradyrhizobium liaoningense]